MPHVQPIFLPRPVVEENRLVLENDFVVEPRQFSFGPDGRLHVLSKLSYNYFRYDKTDDRDFSTYLVNVYAADYSPERIADFSALYQSAKGAAKFPDHFDWDRFDPCLAITPDNLALLTTQANRAFLFDALWQRRVGHFAAPDSGDLQRVYDEGFAYQVEPTADGALLCVVSEPGVHTFWFSPNLVCLSTRPSPDTSRPPELTCLASLKADLSADATFPYIRTPGGARVGKGTRPAPSLADQVGQQFERGLLYNPWIGQALPLTEGRVLVSLYSAHSRGGSKGRGFVFALMSHGGRVIGRLEGIDRYAESPYVGHHYRLGVDRAQARIVYKNKTSFFLFDFDGRLLAQTRLEGKSLQSLAALKLGGCSPDGRIILYHPDQHLLVAVDPFDAPADLTSALDEAMTCLRTERGRLKKRYEWAHSRWLHPGPVERH